MSHPMFDDTSPAWRQHALLEPDILAELDRVTVTLGTPGFTLMERAATAVVQTVEARYRPCPTLVVCGPGLNGGDGLVVAELLRRRGWPVQVVMLTPPEALRGDASLARVFYQGEILPWTSGQLNGQGLVIDAVFGIGLNREVEGPFFALIEALNASGLPIVAVDMPSGVHASYGSVLGTAVRAEVTVTFTRKKPGQLLLPGRAYCGIVHVAEIGIDHDALNNVPMSVVENHPELWLALLPGFLAGQHKYDHGHALILGGSVMTGAARLAARAAQRVGTGLVSIAADEASALVYATNLDSVLVLKISHDVQWQHAVNDPKKTAMLLGPGAGVGEGTLTKVILALTTRKPCVLDADALTSFIDGPEELYGYLYPEAVLTPHVGEFNRLFGKNEQVDKCTRTSRAARLSGSVVLLKGADTVIAAPNGLQVINANAPAWLATAGSGDVLSGIITGLMAQGVKAFPAAAIGAWLHGAAAEHFQPGMIAEDLIEALPRTLAHIRADEKEEVETDLVPTPSNGLKSVRA